MAPLHDVTSFFQVERIHDVGLFGGFAVAAAGREGLALVNTTDGSCMRLPAKEPFDRPILISGNRIFFSSFRGVPTHDPAGLRLEPFLEEGARGLDASCRPHFSFATDKSLYGLCGEGDLVRIDLERGTSEIPSSPYGRYDHNDLCAVGLGIAPRGVVVLSRHAAREETLVDVLPDNPGRPIARAAVLKDREWGKRISGPAVASRWVHLLCHEKACLLSRHLHNPDVMHETPLPGRLSGKDEVFLAADGAGRVLAADRSGLHVLLGQGAPAFYPFPSNERHTPARLLGSEPFALILTEGGRLFALPH